jgi:hypothetical protein
MKAIDASGKVEPRNWCFLKVSFFVWKTVGPLKGIWLQGQQGGPVFHLGPEYTISTGDLLDFNWGPRSLLNTCLIVQIYLFKL